MEWKVLESVIRLNLVERFLLKHGGGGLHGRGARKTPLPEALQKPKAPPAACLTDGTAWAGDTED